MASYSLQNYRLHFTSDFSSIQIVRRTDLTDVQDEYTFDGTNAVQLVVSAINDSIELILHPDGFDHDVQAAVEADVTSFFGFDSYMMGGIGISDLRDQDKHLVEVFDLGLGTFAFSLRRPGNSSIATMYMLGKNHDADQSMYWQLVRTGVFRPN
jgi:hypothetical protein